MITRGLSFSGDACKNYLWLQPILAIGALIVGGQLCPLTPIPHDMSESLENKAEQPM